MDRKLIDYLPPVLQEVVDFQVINGANEPEIALAWDILARILANQFLETADIWGVSVWEKELKLFPKDTDSMELRKARIKAMWNREMPYTMPWLSNWMTGLFGKEKHGERTEDYTLILQLKQDLSDEMACKTNELFEMLSDIIPENILMALEYIFPVLPAYIPTRVIPFPRLSRSSPPRYHADLPPGRAPLALGLGMRYSTITLPMAAHEGG